MPQRERKGWLKGWSHLSVEELVVAVQGIRTESDLDVAKAKGLDSRIRELKRSIERQSGLQTQEREDAILTIEEHVESLIGGKK